MCFLILSKRFSSSADSVYDDFAIATCYTWEFSILLIL